MVEIQLEENNLGKPTSFEPTNENEKSNKKIPQAYEKNGNWYYNYEGAILEARSLGKIIPTKEQWQEIVKSFGQDGNKLSKNLGLKFTGFYQLVLGYIKYKLPNNGCYWSSTSNGIEAYSLNFNINTISPTFLEYKSNCISVRCLKN